jgi:hypothetical protein
MEGDLAVAANRVSGPAGHEQDVAWLRVLTDESFKCEIGESPLHYRHRVRNGLHGHRQPTPA